MKLRPSQQDRIDFLNTTLKSFSDPDPKLTPQMRQLFSDYVAGRIGLDTMLRFLRDGGT